MIEAADSVVAVLGGGPAASAAACTLAGRGVDVALIAGHHDHRWRVGETLPPEVRSSLEAIGAWPAFVADDHVPAYGTWSAWGSGSLQHRSFVFDPYGAGWHLDRRRFDATLRSVAAAVGAAVSENAQAVAAKRDETGWELLVRRPGAKAPTPLTARFVIDATGRASWLARGAGSRRRPIDRLVGVAVRMTIGADAGEETPDTLVEAVENGWWYSAVVPGRRLVVIFHTDADLLPTGARRADGFLRMLESTRHTLARVRRLEAAAVEPPRVVGAASFRLTHVHGDRWVAAGDAVCSTDPLSSRGVLAAVTTGRAAAQAVQAWLDHDDEGLHGYREAILQRWARYLGTRAAYYAEERRWPASTFWSRRNRLPGTEPGTAATAGRAPPPAARTTDTGGSHGQREALVLHDLAGHRHRARGEQPGPVLHRP